ncbi:hypothetical protein DH2020_011565 [Rehmannia glutinosa]|uniref:DOG1 domain-containing protein n=1 Tax=Rehmannia glutinosa TaxID=99300 RepID=A0ABR0XDS1_REHGL
MASFNHSHFNCCFQNWILQQRQDLEELLNALSTDSQNRYEELKEKGIRHFEEYSERRALMAPHDAASFMTPPWCSSFENAFLWVGGCRPSLSVRLVYAVGGSELEAQIDEFLGGVRKGNLAEISGHQLDLINALHCRTIKEEDKMSTRMASIQANCVLSLEIADEPLVTIAKNAGRVGEWSRELERAMVAHSVSLAHILADADKLRLDTLKELIAILTPLQAVDFLAAAKKLHISMHEWGKRRDRQFGNPLITNII